MDGQGFKLLDNRQYRSVCYNIVRPKALAKDLYQETLITIYEKGYDLEKISKTGGLIYFFARVAYLTFKSNKFQYFYKLKGSLVGSNPLVRGQNMYLTHGNIYEPEDGDEMKNGITYIYIKEEQDIGTENELTKLVNTKKTTAREQYYDLLLNKYIEFNGRIDDIVEQTGIPRRTLFHNLKQARLYYKARL